MGLPQVGASTPLMDLGLDSLGATQLANTLARKTGLSLPPTLVFDYSTVSALASTSTAAHTPAPCV